MQISAVIDTYNSETYILEAINSVLAQERQVDELIIVDDGSTDETVTVIEKAITSVPYARLVRQENGGQLKCLTTGICAAKGDIIALLDGDDMWKSNHIKEAEEKFQEYPKLAMYFCNYEAQGGEHIGAVRKYPEMLFQSTFAVTALAEAFIGDVTATLVFRTNAIQPYLPIPPILEKEWVVNADNVLIWIASLAGEQKYSSSSQNVIYRVHEKSSHKTSNDAIIKARKRLATKRLFEHFRREFYIPLDIDKALKREYLAHGVKHENLRKAYKKASTVAGKLNWF